METVIIVLILGIVVFKFAAFSNKKEKEFREQEGPKMRCPNCKEGILIPKEALDE